jgi:hypothetical protein
MELLELKEKTLLIPFNNLLEKSIFSFNKELRGIVESKDRIKLLELISKTRKR